MTLMQGVSTSTLSPELRFSSAVLKSRHRRFNFSTKAIHHAFASRLLDKLVMLTKCAGGCSALFREKQHNRPSLGKTPRISMAEDSSPRDLSTPPQSLRSFGVGRDDRP